MTDEKDSPDKDKDPTIIDDTTPPEMGEGEEVVTGGEEKPPEPPVTGEGKEAELSPELQEVMRKKGFKDVSELAKAYEGLERKTTELEQDARLKSFVPTSVPQRPRTKRETKPYPELTKEPYDMSKEEYETFRQKEREAIKDELRSEYEEAESDKEWNRMYQEAMNKIADNPEKFERLRPTMSRLNMQYPNASLDQLYSAAEKVYKDDREKQKKEFLTDVFGPDVDLAQVKTILSKARPATISSASGEGPKKPISEMSREEKEKKIKEGIFGESSGLIQD